MGNLTIVALAPVAIATVAVGWVATRWWLMLPLAAYLLLVHC